MELKEVETDGLVSVFRLHNSRGEEVLRNSGYDFDDILNLEEFQDALRKLDVNTYSFPMESLKCCLEVRSWTNEKGPIPIGDFSLERLGVNAA